MATRKNSNLKYLLILARLGLATTHEVALAHGVKPRSARDKLDKLHSAGYLSFDRNFAIRADGSWLWCLTHYGWCALFTEYDSAAVRASSEAEVAALRAALDARASHLKSHGGGWGRPSVLYSPGLTLDGNEWCALYGLNVQDGVAGFGASPEIAMADFDVQWRRAAASLGEGADA